MPAALETLPFVEVLAALHRVNAREELLEWAYTTLSRLVDFSSMACLMADSSGATSRIRDVIATPDISACFSGIGEHQSSPPGGALPEAPRDDGLDGASTALMEFWLRDRCAVEVTAASTRDGPADVALIPLLECLEVDSIAAHGVKETFSGSTTFVMLGAPPSRARTQATLDVLELIMPSLHVARHRIYSNERAVQASAQPVSLTAKETRILSLIARGKTDAEIAALTGRSVHTIKNQVRHVLRKLCVRSRAQAVLQAVQRELMPLE